MIRFRVIAIAAAFLPAVRSAGAQRWGGSPVSHTSSSDAHQASAHPAGAAAWNGTPSKWGGSPAETRRDSRERIGFASGTNAYVPVAVVAPEPVPVTYTNDPGCAPVEGPVEMQVITTNREPRQLTTIEVYRLQPRFQKP